MSDLSEVSIDDLVNELVLRSEAIVLCAKDFEFTTRIKICGDDDSCRNMTLALSAQVVANKAKAKASNG